VAEHRFFLSGEVDLANATDVEADLCRVVHASDDDLIIDCNQLSFIDSSGIYALQRTQHLLQEQGRDFRIVHAGRQPRRIFAILGLLEDLRVDA
jgi:anti-sigma B factor antagonist